MKPIKVLLHLCGSLILASCVGPFASPSSHGVLSAETDNHGVFRTSFGSYRGSLLTLPPGMFIAGENADGTDASVGGFNPFTGVHRYRSGEPFGDADFDGFGAFTAGDGRYSFGIRESGPTGLENARLFLRYQNRTGRTIVGFSVQYDVEAWTVGERDNQIRIKYNTFDSGFSAVNTLVSVLNPRANLIAQGEELPAQLNGTLPENRTTVAFRFRIADQRNANGPLSSLSPGQTGFFRWQFSNGTFEDGEIRSALAITNIEIRPIFAP